MTFTDISYEVEDQIAVITLDRPDALNAFTVTMAYELLDAFDHADADDDVRAVIVTGRGRGFCAGADLGTGADTFNIDSPPAELRDPDRDLGGLVALRIFESLKPVIAAINGPAVGVGITMTLPMDVRIAAEGAKIGFVFAGRGIAPDAASSWFLPRVVGISQALEWTLTSRVFRAEEALAGGLVRSLHPADQVLAAAKALGAEMAAGAAPVSAALTRQLMWRMLSAHHPMESHRLDSKAIIDTGRGADAYEGVSAFLEKRPPRWTMSVRSDLPSWFPWWEEETFAP
jgi:enoyl-CoA hydratase/carnithine racemase